MVADGAKWAESLAATARATSASGETSHRLVERLVLDRIGWRHQASPHPAWGEELELVDGASIATLERMCSEHPLSCHRDAEVHCGFGRPGSTFSYHSGVDDGQRWWCATWHLLPALFRLLLRKGTKPAGLDSAARPKPLISGARCQTSHRPHRGCHRAVARLPAGSAPRSSWQWHWYLSWAAWMVARCDQADILSTTDI